jgi:hypothetical protein
MGEAKREHVVMARFNQGELDRLDALRGVFGMTRAKYIRTRALAEALPRSGRVPELNIKAWTDLSRAAGNLNQIAHRLNELRLHGASGDVDIDEVADTLKEFRMALIGAAADLAGDDGDEGDG